MTVCSMSLNWLLQKILYSLRSLFVSQKNYVNEKSSMHGLERYQLGANEMLINKNLKSFEIFSKSWNFAVFSNFFPS